jgi:hypothetical protein
MAVAAGAGLLIGLGLDWAHVPQWAKAQVNAGIDAIEPDVAALGQKVVSGLEAWRGIADNARVIGQVATGRAQGFLAQVVDGVGDLFGGLFGRH